MSPSHLWVEGNIGEECRVLLLAGLQVGCGVKVHPVPAGRQQTVPQPLISLAFNAIDSYSPPVPSSPSRGQVVTWWQQVADAAVLVGDAR